MLILKKIRVISYAEKSLNYQLKKGFKKFDIFAKHQKNAITL